MANKFEKMEQSISQEMAEAQKKLIEKSFSKRPVEINLLQVLTNDSKPIFEKLTDKAKDIARKTYEKIYNTEGVNRLAGKLETALSQKRVNVYEEKLLTFKNAIDQIDYRINLFNQAEKELTDYKENFLKSNIPGLEGIDNQLKKIREEREKLLNKKDKIASKFEIEKNKRDVYVEKRNIIAQRLIDYYNQKIKPFEQKMEILNQRKNDLENKWKETTKQYEERIMVLEKQKNDLYQILTKIGLSERKINNDSTIKTLEKLINDTKKQLNSQRIAIEKQILEAEKRIEKINNRMRPQVEKRNEFLRIIERAPLDVSINKEEDNKEEEKEEKKEEVVKMEETEEKEKAIEMRIEEFLKYWDNYLKASSRKDFENYQFSEKQFIEKFNISPKKPMDIKNFVVLLKNFYDDYPKNQQDRVRMLIDDFIIQLPKEKGE
ncbi:MAG: hypothetical protein N2692_00845 [Patescibacteria group bacterium]|nr:hypothetical protein [Patescibacteria group bacterium]